MPNPVQSALSALSSTLHDQLPLLALPALVFLLLALARHGRAAIAPARLMPGGFKVNALSYLFDVLLIAGPLNQLVGHLSALVAKNGLTLFAAQDVAALPAWWIALLAVFAGDAVSYFRHRFEHSRWLWPAHALHHSDDAMSWFTIFRFHPINRFTTTAIDMGILLALGFPGWALIVNSLVRHFYGMLIHADVPWTYGALGRVFVSPAMHRWHHVLEGRGMHSNYATVFSVFDQLFGTYYLPGPCRQPLGVKGIEHRSFTLQLLHPFALLLRSARQRLLAG